MLETAPAPGGEYAAYREVLAQQALLPPSEWTFKANPAYRQILEHVSPQQGREYLALLEQSPRWAKAQPIVVRAALANDSVGQPEQAHFDGLGIACSPTNLRYASQALAIWEHIEDIGLKDVYLIEIGGGYGGLALYVDRLARLFEVEFGGHTIIDLPEANAIQRAYANRFRLAVEVVDGSDAARLDRLKGGANDFLVSCYGFSEFSPEVQAWYEERVVRHCDHGYLVWNGPWRQFTGKPLTILPERPQTGGGNTVVTF